MRIVIITDSLGLPRISIEQELFWTDKIIEKLILMIRDILDK
jgi:hypothetical protein